VCVCVQSAVHNMFISLFVQLCTVVCVRLENRISYTSGRVLFNNISSSLDVNYVSIGFHRTRVIITNIKYPRPF